MQWRNAEVSEPRMCTRLTLWPPPNLPQHTQPQRTQSSEKQEVAPHTPVCPKRSDSEERAAASEQRKGGPREATALMCHRVPDAGRRDAASGSGCQLGKRHARAMYHIVIGKADRAPETQSSLREASDTPGQACSECGAQGHAVTRGREGDANHSLPCNVSYISCHP